MKTTRMLNSSGNKFYRKYLFPSAHRFRDVLKSLYHYFFLPKNRYKVPDYLKRFLDYQKLTLFSFLLFISFRGSGQGLKTGDSQYSIEIPVTSSMTKIDGVPDEPAWEAAGNDATFWLHYPVDSGKPVLRSMISDDDNRNNFNSQSERATYNLIGFEFGVSFSAELLWTGLFQYNTQNENMKFNSILKWRFAPMSDLYLILKNDTNGISKSRTTEVLVKLTCWLAL